MKIDHVLTFMTCKSWGTSSFEMCSDKDVTSADEDNSVQDGISGKENRLQAVEVCAGRNQSGSYSSAFQSIHLSSSSSSTNTPTGTNVIAHIRGQLRPQTCAPRGTRLLALAP